MYVLEFNRTSDQRHNYREQGERRARAQHDVLVKSPDTVAKEAKGENAGWTIKLIIFVGGTCGSVHVQTVNNNLKELGVVELKRNTIRRGFVHELLNDDDDPFIVLTETKFSFHCIPVWIGTLLAGLGSKKRTHVIMFSP